MELAGDRHSGRGFSLSPAVSPPHSHSSADEVAVFPLNANADSPRPARELGEDPEDSCGFSRGPLHETTTVEAFSRRPSGRCPAGDDTNWACDSNWSLAMPSGSHLYICAPPQGVDFRQSLPLEWCRGPRGLQHGLSFHGLLKRWTKLGQGAATAGPAKRTPFAHVFTADYHSHQLRDDAAYSWKEPFICSAALLTLNQGGYGFSGVSMEEAKSVLCCAEAPWGECSYSMEVLAHAAQASFYQAASDLIYTPPPSNRGIHVDPGVTTSAGRLHRRLWTPCDAQLPSTILAREENLFEDIPGDFKTVCSSPEVRPLQRCPQACLVYVAARIGLHDRSVVFVG
eukprot:SM000058S18576  [mRNA]  locus=s58:690523:693675:+ [translate_table: standard]